MKKRTLGQDFSQIETFVGPVIGLKYEQITDLSASIGLAPPDGARYAVLVAETQAVRYREDGTDPAAGVGMPIAVGVPTAYHGNLSKVKFIQQAASAKLNVHYYG